MAAPKSSAQPVAVLRAQHEKLLALVRERDKNMAAYDEALLQLSEDDFSEYDRRTWKDFARNFLAMVQMVRPLVYQDYRGVVRIQSPSWWGSIHRPAVPTVPAPNELDAFFGADPAGWPVLEPATTHPLHNPNAVAEFIAQVQAGTAGLPAAAPEKGPPPTLGEIHDVLVAKNLKELSLLFRDDEE